MEPINITVDEKWIKELLIRLDKYDMFEDRRQKIVKWVQTTANDQAEISKGKITQNQVEEWCKSHKTKLVQDKNLLPLPSEGIGCSFVWIKPYDENGTCTVHKQCLGCGLCIDGSEGVWNGGSKKPKLWWCQKCKPKESFPSDGPKIDCCRPKFVTKSKVKKVVKKHEEERVKISKEMKKLTMQQLKSIAAENGISSSGDIKELIKRLDEYLIVHHKFKRNLPKN